MEPYFNTTSTNKKKIIKDGLSRRRLGPNTDDQGKTCGETDYDELSCGGVRTAQETNNSMEKCEVCHRSFKKRGIKIHQAKSGCKKALNRIKNSKSEAEGLQETHHSDSFCTEEPNSIYPEKETPVGDKESKDGTDRSNEKSQQIIKGGMKNTSDLKE